MRYAKPVLVPMADARVAIQSNGDGSDPTHDKELVTLETGSNFHIATNAAYEADE